jgi:hypothetical protein
MRQLNVLSEFSFNFYHFRGDLPMYRKIYVSPASLTQLMEAELDPETAQSYSRQ